MRICLTINEALKIAEYTGQLCKITLDSGREFLGVVEELWPTSCRVWLNPCMPCNGNEIEKAIIANHAIRCIAFGCESVVENTNCSNHVSSSCLQGIRDALTAACLTKQLVAIGIHDKCHSKEVEACVISVSSNTCCLRLRNCCENIEVCIADIEYVIFG
jgi:hypothetical protein